MNGQHADAPTDTKITTAEKPAPLSVSPIQRLADLTLAIGKLQTETGMVLRHGPNGDHPEKNGKIVLHFMAALLNAKNMIEIVQGDIAQATAQGILRRAA